MTFLVRRLMRLVLLMVVVSFGVFVFIDIAPGDPAIRVAGADASPERIQEVRTALHLDEPVLPRYGRWLVHAVQGDLGKSLTSGRSATDSVLSAFAVTAALATVAVLISIVGGVAMGTLAALRDGTAIDRVITTLCAVAVAAPAFWIGLVLVGAFAVDRPFLPALGYVSWADDPVAWLRHLILPGIALAAMPGAELTMQLRAALVETLSRDYILAAVAKGIARWKIIAKHAAKNAAVPVTTVLGYRVAQIIGSTAIIETLFVMPGLGRLAVTSVLASDTPVILGVVLLSTLVVLAVNFVVDLSHVYFNPRATHV